MVPMSLFSRSSDLPGVQGATRDLSANGKGFKRLAPGDFAIIDAPDISRAMAQRLIDARPAAVINAAKFSTGSLPNFGPQMLLEAGITLVEAVGAEVWLPLKDGKKARLTDDGQLFYGEKLIATGHVVSQGEAESTFVEAQQHLVDYMEAFFGNTIQFIHSEAPLLIDGLGVPEVGEALRERKVVVVSPGAGYQNQLKELRNFIREFEPAIIGVDSAADTLVEMGYKPDFIVGDPSNIGAEALRSGARVVLPADPDGHAPGLERIQDLGIGAMTFPSAVENSTDLALLLADYHEAQIVVNIGAPITLDQLFAQAENASPSALLSRTKLGPRLVDASAISNLYMIRSSGNIGWLWALLGILVAVATIVAIAGSSGDGSFSENLVDTWNNIAVWFQGLFSSGKAE
ncbi:MAG: putative cytokinetic ring protein SteA [Corynebacterium sp.]|uniref:putative cytokinetic ring protein SteA n=1 Tax=Corynebacterium sp. TaxID=1720 RepID=UPI0026DAEB34|nr:putative cytokinetic ring protein SteA [Corynebacterium sp.]MDO5098271.1 putative cytokinetic ring protein SteA [Corynebacterium sp.]